MTDHMQPLREEHRHLLPHIEQLRTAADAVGDAPIEQLHREVDAAHAFLTHHLIPHAQREDRVLYPAVEQAMKAPQATATMSRDHEEVGRLTNELGALQLRLSDTELDAALAKDLRRVLYGLYALVHVHFAKEEEIYVPILEAHLTAEEAHDLFEEMEAAT
jgi:iron-sulfur cluster repair protein YtfE (RIC family)